MSLEDQFKNKMNSGTLDEMTKQMNGFLENTKPLFERFAGELKKTVSPVSKRDVKINGVSCAVSLIDDNRVIVHLPSMDDAKKLYDNIETVQIKKSFWQKILFR